MGGVAAEQTRENEFVRLHITPFHPTLLDRFIPPSLQSLARNISYHAVQTFPERGFGYIELPVMEARKLKAKLNGSTLKGTKVKIEDARPERKRRDDDKEKKNEEEENGEEGRTAKKSRKAEKKRQEGVLPGHEMEAGRRVKRGWTDDDGESGKKREKDKNKKSRMRDGAGGMDDRKLQFKTSLPPNATPIETRSRDKAKKKVKDGKPDKKRKNITVVQEFSKSKKTADIDISPGESKHGNLRYEDGRGWIDENDNLVDAEPVRKRPKRKLAALEATKQSANDTDQVQQQPTHKAEAHNESTSSDSEGDGTAESSDEVASSAESLPEPAKDLHPLEALFKRSLSSPTDPNKPKPAPIDTSFSFFNSNATKGDGDDDNDDDYDDEKSNNDVDTSTLYPPQTPHTRRDLEWRSVRSAAPTPETAAIGRHFSLPFSPGSDSGPDEPGHDNENGDVDMENRDQAGTSAPSQPPEGAGTESAFRTWFYENRGDFNRGWKKRRREERKAKRQSENRRLGRKMA